MTSRAKQGLLWALAAVMVLPLCILLWPGSSSANHGPKGRGKQKRMASKKRRRKKEVGHVPLYFSLGLWGTGTVGTPDNGPGQTWCFGEKKPAYTFIGRVLSVPGDLPEARPIVKVDEAGVAEVRGQLPAEAQRALDKTFQLLDITPTTTPTTPRPAPTTPAPTTPPETPTVTVVDQAGVERYRVQMPAGGQQKLDELFRAIVQPSNTPPPEALGTTRPNAPTDHAATAPTGSWRFLAPQRGMRWSRRTHRRRKVHRITTHATSDRTPAAKQKEP